jgi:XRE family aerobic/anaerobic benzoate catabolism transcriptional regulator
MRAGTYQPVCGLQRAEAMRSAMGRHNDPLLDAFGRRLRALRVHRRVSIRALAQAAGVSERYLSDLEHGYGNPSLLVLHQVACALGCQPAALIDDALADTVRGS